MNKLEKIQQIAQQKLNVLYQQNTQYCIKTNHPNCGFDLTRSYGIKEAHKIVDSIRKDGHFTELYPVEYVDFKVTAEQASIIARAKYEKVLAQNPDNYGPLQKRRETPVFYIFVCSDFELQEQGMVPGWHSIAIDKLSGKVLSKTELMDYYFLQDSHEIKLKKQ